MNQWLAKLEATKVVTKEECLPRADDVGTALAVELTTVKSVQLVLICACMEDQEKSVKFAGK